MKKLLRSTFGTLVVAAFLAIAPPMYARGGHGGGHGGHRDGHSGHGGGHAARLMFEEETMALVFAGGVVTTLLGRRAAMRAMQGANIMPLAAAAGELTGQIRTTNIRVTAWAIMA